VPDTSAIKYVAHFETRLKGDDGKTYTLIWGDRCELLGKPTNGKVKVRARAQTGTMPADALGDERLLEIYVIDVGQGDGILFHTPDDAWHLVDGGKRRKGKNDKGAANFLRWKFHRDLGLDTVPLRSVILTHPDDDHFGGLIDVLAGSFGHPDDDPEVTVEGFFHSGLAKYPGGKLGEDVAGEVGPFPRGDRGIPRKGRFITELLEGKTSFRSPKREFATEYGQLAKLVGKVPSNVNRVDSSWEFLHGYGEGENPVTIRILGPVLEDFGGGKGLRVLGKESITVNGHSVVLRLEYDRARVLLTGDLNEQSQKLLLSYEPEEDFAVDVAKACHHGSEDIDLAFLKALRARATVISSGDNEGFAHPRPMMMGAAGRYGREGVDATAKRETVVPPLIYSTELARSVKLEFARDVRVPADDGGAERRTVDAADTELVSDDDHTNARRLDVTPISPGTVYGLVNVRTDGKSILCATMREITNDFDIKVFKAGTSPSGES
jgi:beta-lactamase superfamily II metal-dependent hydrolase